MESLKFSIRISRREIVAEMEERRWPMTDRLMAECALDMAVEASDGAFWPGRDGYEVYRLSGGYFLVSALRSEQEPVINEFRSA